MPGTEFALVDAFVTDRAFSGNPAGVVLLDDLSDDAWMQGVANELAQAETAFLAPADDGTVGAVTVWRPLPLSRRVGWPTGPAPRARTGYSRSRRRMSGREEEG